MALRLSARPPSDQADVLNRLGELDPTDWLGSPRCFSNSSFDSLPSRAIGDLGDRGRPGGPELVDDERGGGHGELHGLAQVGPGGQGGGEVGGDRVAGADDIDRAADRDAPGRARGRGPARRRRCRARPCVTKTGWPVRPASSAAWRLHGLEIEWRRIRVIRASSAAFILKPSGGKSCRPRRLSARTTRRGFFSSAAWAACFTRRGDDAGLGPIDLVQQQERVHPVGQRADPVGQVALKVVGRRRPVLGVEPVQLARRPVRLDHHRLAVDRRAPRRRR